MSVCKKCESDIGFSGNINIEGNVNIEENTNTEESADSKERTGTEESADSKEHTGTEESADSKEHTDAENDEFYENVYEQIYQSNEVQDVDRIDNDSQHSIDEILSRNDAHSMRNHNKHYNNILKQYSKNLKASLDLKNKFKSDFYYKCINIVIGLIFAHVFIILSVIGFYRFNIYIPENVSTAITVSAIGSLISSFIALPIIIAKYLFNPNEERDIMKVIKNIQNHDKAIRNRLFKKKQKNNNRINRC